MKTFKAPLVSRVTALPVQPGERVSAGQVIAVLTPRAMEELPDFRIPGIESPIDGYVVIYPGVTLGAQIEADAPVFSIMTAAEKAAAVPEGGLVIQATEQVVLLSDQPVPGMPEGAVRIPVTPPVPGSRFQEEGARDCELGPKERLYGRGMRSGTAGFLLSKEPPYQIALGWTSVGGALKNFPAHLDGLTDDHLLTLVVMARAYLQCDNYPAFATLSMLVLLESIAHRHKLHPEVREIITDAVGAFSLHRTQPDAPECFIPTTAEEFVRSLRTYFGPKTREELFGEPPPLPPAPVKAAPLSPAPVKAAPLSPAPPPLPAPVKAAPGPQSSATARGPAVGEVPNLLAGTPIGGWVWMGVLLFIVMCWSLCSSRGAATGESPAAQRAPARPAQAAPPAPPTGLDAARPAPPAPLEGSTGQEVSAPRTQDKHRKTKTKTKHKHTRAHRRH